VPARVDLSDRPARAKGKDDLMGEYAEMMLDGTCCAGCGEFMGGGDGFATYCSSECAREHGAEYWGSGDNLTLHDPKQSSLSKAGFRRCGND
jgi:hypothetical protein